MKERFRPLEDYIGHNREKEQKITVVEFQCNTGYKLQGRNKLRCVNGEWDGRTPKCVRASEC